MANKLLQEKTLEFLSFWGADYDSFDELVADLKNETETFLGRKCATIEKKSCKIVVEFDEKMSEVLDMYVYNTDPIETWTKENYE